MVVKPPPSAALIASQPQLLLEVQVVALDHPAVFGLSGKPFKPSTTAIRISWTPRVFRSFITFSVEV